MMQKLVQHIPGRIQVAPETYHRLLQEFDFEEREPVEVRERAS
jgi:hypothetical protein